MGFFDATLSFNKLLNTNALWEWTKIWWCLFKTYFAIKIKDGTYVINLDEYADVGTQSIALFCNRNEIVYFNSFDVEHVPEEIKEFIGNKNIKANIFRVQANNSVMCGYFCIGFIDFMLSGKKRTDFTRSFSPYDFE